VSNCSELVLLLCAALLPTTALAEQTAIDRELPFKVISRMDDMMYFPCAGCHEDMQIDPTPRALPEAPHFPELRHGAADIWCTTCHSLEQRESLKTLSGKLVDYDVAYRICAQCHIKAYGDWRHGAHGKRIKRWRGDREVLNCTGCHNPHLDPGFEPRKPAAPPGVRAGLQRRERARHRGGEIWESDPHTEQRDADVPR
jgi:hypothetical protein